MNRRQPYDAEFYQRRGPGSSRSAEVIIGRLSSLISFRSVIDVGCGVGTWLRAVQIHGVSDILGIDGDYVDRAALEIPGDRFLARDLRMPIKLDRQFDLAISLEVAEHLPPECACDFVASLAGLAPLILFSAAIPFQGGTHHVNEQWPHYWATLFKDQGYLSVDCIRRHVWDDPSVDWWYSQNVFVYASKDGFSKNSVLGEIQHQSTLSDLSLVHPRTYLRFVDPVAPGGFRRSLSLTAGAAKSVFRKRLTKLSGYREGKVERGKR
jgi:SAM-dependent methyltransferase